MIEINFIFSVGFRCISPDFLKKYNLRQISGPFDYLYVDLETSLMNINNNFREFLTNIVFVNKINNLKNIYYSENKIDKKILNFIQNKNIYYMGHNYNNINLLINQNFIENTPSNLYNWKRICIFHHHDITKKEVYEKIKKRVNIFKNIYLKKKNKLCLFYITKINENENFNELKLDILNLKKKFNINCYLIIIICSCKLKKKYIFEDNTLFIIKKVKDYNFQSNNGRKTDNVLSYKKEFNIIGKFFKMNLIDYEKIINKYNF